MPLINVEIGKLSREQKLQLISRLSRTASEITGIPLNAFMIVINELDDENIGIGGRSIGELKAEADRE